MVNLPVGIAVFLSVSLPALAGTWSGVLVDSKCYAAEERNVNARDTLTDVDRDRNLEIRYCRPNAHTKSFAVVQQNGLSFLLDSAGNTKATGIVQTADKKSHLVVDLTGEMTKELLEVDAIVLVR